MHAKLVELFKNTWVFKFLFQNVCNLCGFFKQFSQFKNIPNNITKVDFFPLVENVVHLNSTILASKLQLDLNFDLIPLRIQAFKLGLVSKI